MPMNHEMKQLPLRKNSTEKNWAWYNRGRHQTVLSLAATSGEAGTSGQRSHLRGLEI